MPGDKKNAFLQWEMSLEGKVGIRGVEVWKPGWYDLGKGRGFLIASSSAPPPAEEEPIKTGKYQELPALLYGTLAFTYHVSQQGKEECESTRGTNRV